VIFKSSMEGRGTNHRCSTMNRKQLHLKPYSSQ
jgi:hypothetical protein